MFVCVLGDETAQVSSADCKLSPVSGALQCPHHTSRTKPEGERSRSLPPDCPKCSRKVGNVVLRHAVHTSARTGRGRKVMQILLCYITGQRAVQKEKKEGTHT